MDEPRHQSTASFWAPVMISLFLVLLMLGWIFRFPW